LKKRKEARFDSSRESSQSNAVHKARLSQRASNTTYKWKTYLNNPTLPRGRGQEMNMLKNMNNFQQTNTPRTWEEIDKVKWTKYVKKNSLFNGFIENNQFQNSPQVNALEGIYKSNKQHFENKVDPFNPPRKHKNLYSLVMSKDLLRISYNKLKKNKGALTPGTANQTADAMSEKVIETIHTQRKTHTFKWNPTKKIEVQKPGRAPGVTRPLGLPDFNDKMVQNNIMLILTAIYEPEFQFINSNSTHDSVGEPNCRGHLSFI
jgi:hypothetical protein